LAEQTAGDNLGTVTEDDTMEVESACWWTGGGVSRRRHWYRRPASSSSAASFLNHQTAVLRWTPSAKKTRETVAWEYYFASGYPVGE